MNRHPLRKLFPYLFIFGMILAWEFTCVAFGISDLVLPRPSQIARVLWEKYPAIWPHAYQTLYTTLIGFAIGVAVGVLLGVAVGSSALVYETVYPLLIGFYSIPKVAIVPILVIWFGSGTVPAILTAVVMCIFPVVVNVATGLATVEPELEDVLRALGATRMDILLKVGLPRSMPYLFASLKIAVTLAFVGAVLSESVASNRGIGNMMVIASGQFDVPLAFAGLTILAVMGIVLYAIFAAIEKRTTGWAHRKADFNN